MKRLFVCLVAVLVTQQIHADDFFPEGYPVKKLRKKGQEVSTQVAGSFDLKNAWFKPELLENNAPNVCETLLQAKTEFFMGRSDDDPLVAYDQTGHKLNIHPTEKSVFIRLIDKSYEFPDGSNISYSETPSGSEKYFSLVTIDNSIGWREFYGHVLLSKPLDSFNLTPENYESFLHEHEMETLLKLKEKGAQYHVLYKGEVEPNDYASRISIHPAAFFGYAGNYYLTATEDDKSVFVFLVHDEKNLDLSCKIRVKPYPAEIEKQAATLKEFAKYKQYVSQMMGTTLCDEGSGHYQWNHVSDMNSYFQRALYEPWMLTGNLKNIGLERWGYSGIWNHHVYQSFIAAQQPAINELKNFYKNNYSLSDEDAISYATNAVAAPLNAFYILYGADPETVSRFDFRDNKGRQDFYGIVIAILDGMPVDELKKKLADYDQKIIKRGDLLLYSTDRPEVTKLLLELGADPNASNTQSGFGKNALMYASQFNQLQTANILLQGGADPNAYTVTPEYSCGIKTDKMTPLHYAARYASPEVIKLLLDNGAQASMKAINRNNYREAIEEIPLDWLHRYAAPDAKERNPYIPDNRVLEIESWLQPLSPDVLLSKVQGYISSAEQNYQKDNIKDAYRDLAKVLEIQPENERALGDMSLVALKNGNLGVSLEASNKLIKSSKENKTRANAWFNQGLACEKHSASGEKGWMSYNGQNYCSQTVLYSYLQAWLSDKSVSRSKKLSDLFNKEDIDSCEITPVDGEVYKIHFAKVDKKQKIYIHHLAKNTIDPSQIYWEIKFWDPKTNTSREPTRFVPTFVTQYNFGDYVLDELESQQNVQFPVRVDSLTCRSEKSKDYGATVPHTELHIVGAYTTPDNYEHCPPWHQRCGTMSMEECHEKLANKECEYAGTIAVNIQPNKNPIILALSAYDKTKWVIRNDSNVKIEKIILGGYYSQDILGVDSNIPVERFVREGAPCQPNCSDRRDYFYSSGSPAELIEKIIGLVPTSFQWKNYGKEFNVPRTDKTIHVIAVDRGQEAADGNTGTIHVNILATDKPLTLALSAESKVKWIIEGEGVKQIERVLLGGTDVQTVSGLPSTTPIDVYTKVDSPCVQCVKHEEFHDFKNYSEDTFAQKFGVVPQSIQRMNKGDKIVVSPINKGHFSID